MSETTNVATTDLSELVSEMQDAVLAYRSMGVGDESIDNGLRARFTDRIFDVLLDPVEIPDEELSKIERERLAYRDFLRLRAAPPREAEGVREAFESASMIETVEQRLRHDPKLYHAYMIGRSKSEQCIRDLQADLAALRARHETKTIKESGTETFNAAESFQRPLKISAPASEASDERDRLLHDAYRIICDLGKSDWGMVTQAMHQAGRRWTDAYNACAYAEVLRKHPVRQRCEASCLSFSADALGVFRCTVCGWPDQTEDA